jgi:hypothetical protein
VQHHQHKEINMAKSDQPKPVPGELKKSLESKTKKVVDRLTSTPLGSPEHDKASADFKKIYNDPNSFYK